MLDLIAQFTPAHHMHTETHAFWHTHTHSLFSECDWDERLTENGVAAGICCLMKRIKLCIFCHFVSSGNTCKCCSVLAFLRNSVDLLIPSVIFLPRCPPRQIFLMKHKANTMQIWDQLRRAALRPVCNKTRAKGQEAWRKLLKHWHMRGAEVGQ